MQQYFLFVAALVLPPHFTVISGRYPRPDITVLYLYVRQLIAADMALDLCSSRTITILLGQRLSSTLITPLATNPATGLIMPADTSRSGWQV